MLMEQTVYITKNYSPEAVLNTLGEKAKKRKPLIYKGFRVVVCTGLEPVTP